jgi:hypothetical protein
VDETHGEPAGVRRESVWVSSIFPAASAVLLLAMAVLASWHFAQMIGVSPSDPMAIGFPLAYLVVAVIGLTWALKVRRAEPEKYRALSGPPTPDSPMPTTAVAQEA